MAEQMSRYLTFRELHVRDRFIAVPVDGDDSGHGGFRKASYIFMKVDCTEYNAIRQKDGISTHLPDSMRVLKVE